MFIRCSCPQEFTVLRSKMAADHLKKILVLQEVRLESEIIDVSQVGVFSLLGDSVYSYSALWV